MFIQRFNADLNDVRTKVDEICSTENSYAVDSLSAAPEKLFNSENYSDFGFKSMGRMLNFPAPFVKSIEESDPNLSKEIIENRMRNFFLTRNRAFTVREFSDSVAGVVSDKYSYFDDNEVVDILEDSPLSKLSFQNVIITPERFHLRAIDDNEPFHVSGDKSDMYFTFFVDNSMVGGSSFKVRLGVFRKACTNGLIVPVKEFIICKQVHRGRKDIAAEFNENIAFLSEKKDSIKTLLNDLSTADSAIEKMSEDFKADYLARKLNASQAEAEKIINLYQLTYGGKTKWALVNAVTEFARDIKDIDRREMLETRALKVA